MSRGMRAQEESSSPALPPEGIVALGFALRRMRLDRQPRRLLALLPFLALHRRTATAQMAAGGAGRTGLPWPALRWFAWPERGVEARPAAPGATLDSRQAAVETASASAGETRDRVERAEVLATLAPMLGFAAAARRTVGEGGALLEPQRALARTSPFLAAAPAPPMAPAAHRITARESASPPGPLVAEMADAGVDFGGVVFGGPAGSGRPATARAAERPAAGGVAESFGISAGRGESESAPHASETGAEPAGETAVGPARSGSLVELVWLAARGEQAAERAEGSTRPAGAHAPPATPGAAKLAVSDESGAGQNLPASVPEMAWRSTTATPAGGETVSLPAGAQVAAETEAPVSPEVSVVSGIVARSEAAAGELAPPSQMPWRGSLVDLAAGMMRRRELSSAASEPDRQAAAGLPAVEVSAGFGRSASSHDLVSGPVGLWSTLAALVQAPESSGSGRDGGDVETGGRRLPQAAEADAPLPWRRQHLLAEPAGPAVLHELAAVAEEVEQLVARQVERAVDRHMAQIQTPTPDLPAPAADGALAELVLDDGFVRSLMRKLQSLAEEERTRRGYLHG